MAGPIQIGDAIRLVELAWTVWEYGWGQDNNAGENYRSFGSDVRTLHSGLGQLEGAIKRAQNSLLAHGARERDVLGLDRDSFEEIVGDYKATLDDCHRLLKDNRRYAETTGAVKNIDWNINVKPRVEVLRTRIQMHNSRIQHVLRPFEIDLINNFHGDLAQRITSVHVDVLRVNRNVDTLIAMHYPEVARAIEQREEEELSSVRIPDHLLGRLGAMFDEHTLGRPPTLHEMTDCFLVQFEKSTVLMPVARNSDSKRSPTIPQYLALLKCQLLMDRMKDSEEFRSPPRMSHWPGYVRALEEKLSQQSSRFDEELLEPEVSNCEDRMLQLWHTNENEKKDVPKPTDPVYIEVAYLSLAAGGRAVAWRTLRVSRLLNSETRFKLTETVGFRGSPANEEQQTIDINIRTAALIPIYADPVAKGGTPPPLEIVLEANSNTHRYVFLDLRSLLRFQGALTGYEVAGLHSDESFMEPRAKTVFVKKGNEKSFEEEATVQIWIDPQQVKASPAYTADSLRRPSSGSQESEPSTHIQAGRANSVFSVQSNSAFSTTSYSSSGTENTGAVAIELGARPATAPFATMLRRPRNPLIVLFTRDQQSRRAIVGITVNDDSRPVPERCNCLKYSDCRITALEGKSGSMSVLKAKRLDNGAKWDLLPLASSSNEWDGLQRVSILFPTSAVRQDFGGKPCKCRISTEGDVNKCLSQRHTGLLGAGREYFRRQMLLWWELKNAGREVEEIAEHGRWLTPDRDRRMTR